VAARLPADVKAELASCITTRDGKGNELAVKWEKLDAETLEQLVDLVDYDAQIAAARRLKELKETKQVDNFSASLGGKIACLVRNGYHSHMIRQVSFEQFASTATSQWC
jgi:ATP phosphoribosyltransferase regulatory subunit HisZ